MHTDTAGGRRFIKAAGQRCFASVSSVVRTIYCAMIHRRAEKAPKKHSILTILAFAAYPFKGNGVHRVLYPLLRPFLAKAESINTAMVGGQQLVELPWPRCFGDLIPGLKAPVGPPRRIEASEWRSFW